MKIKLSNQLRWALLLLAFSLSLGCMAQNQLSFESSVDIDEVIFMSNEAYGLITSNNSQVIVDLDGNEMSLPDGQVFLGHDGKKHVLTGIIDNDNGRTQFSLLRIRNDYLEVKGSVDLIDYWTTPLFAHGLIYLTNMWEGSGNQVKVFDYNLLEVAPIDLFGGMYFEQIHIGRTLSGVKAIIKKESKYYLIEGFAENPISSKELDIDQEVRDVTFGNSVILLKQTKNLTALDENGDVLWQYATRTNKYPIVYDGNSHWVVVFSKGEASILNDKGSLIKSVVFSDYISAQSKVIPVSVEFQKNDALITIGELQRTNSNKYRAINSIQISAQSNNVSTRYSSPLYLRNLKSFSETINLVNE